MQEIVNKSDDDKPIYVRDVATSHAVRKLAKLKGTSLTETIRLAVEKEYEEIDKKRPLSERIRHIQDRIAALPETGLKADKEFYDWLSGD
jgi:antitoxin VapB